jgi:hypothetical protein
MLDDDQAPAAVWTTPWVVHAQHAGRGPRVLDHLGRYVFRIAIANSRLEALTDHDVTFRYRDNRTQDVRRVTLTGAEFLQRFVQHVLPRGCAKVRYYGLWSAAHRVDRTRARVLLTAPTVVAAPQALGLRARQGAPTARGVPSVGSARSSSWPYSDRHGSGRHDDVTHAALGTPFQHARWP